MTSHQNPVASTVEIRPQQDQNQSVPEPQIPKPKFVPYPQNNVQNPPQPQHGNQNIVQYNSSGPLKPIPVTPVANAANVKTAYKSKRVFKVIIIGDACVGKTCLSFRFCNGRFPAQTEATIGVDFRERCLVIDNELIRVQLWDTAGQERYRQSIVAHYYRNVNAVVFVYDVTNPASFKSLRLWIDECQKHAVTSGEDTPHILIGNKCDLLNPNRVKTADAQIFADENDMALFETSALADSEADHVESIFMTLVHKLVKSKAMHVQTSQERAERGQKLLLKADEAAKLESGEGWCC
ncbi:ras family domain-containing protein [Ditylenchus destructor]|nr:ras family domain-containing protein [Ditylenchus destructor]